MNASQNPDRMNAGHCCGCQFKHFPPYVHLPFAKKIQGALSLFPSGAVPVVCIPLVCNGEATLIPVLSGVPDLGIVEVFSARFSARLFRSKRSTLS